MHLQTFVTNTRRTYVYKCNLTPFLSFGDVNMKFSSASMFAIFIAALQENVMHCNLHESTHYIIHVVFSHGACWLPVEEEDTFDALVRV